MFLDCHQCVDRAPVEFDRRADAVGSGTEYDDGAAVAFVVDVVFGAVVCQVQVVCRCGVLGGEGVDLLHYRKYPEFAAACAHVESGVATAYVFFKYGTCYLEVAESLLLGEPEQLGRYVGDVVGFFEFGCSVDYVLEFEQEPAVDAGEVVYCVDVVAFGECFRDDEYPLVGR